MTVRTYSRGSALPGIRLPWEYEVTPNVFDDLDLSSGYTFVFELYDRDNHRGLNKTTGITGGDGYVDIAWALTDLDLDYGLYVARMTATETATAKPRRWRPDDPLVIEIVA